MNKSQLLTFAQEICSRMGLTRPTKASLFDVDDGWCVEVPVANERGLRLEFWYDKSSGHPASMFWYGFRTTPNKIGNLCTAVERVTKRSVADDAFQHTEWPLGEPIKEEVGGDRWCGIYLDEKDLDPAEITEFLLAVLLALPRGTAPRDLDEDRRIFALRMVAIRERQSEFRRALLDAYGGRCAISGCAVEEVLEAAHILPYKGGHTSDVINGILLRADLHILFDLDLLHIQWNGGEFEVRLSEKLKKTKDYEKLEGVRLHVPEDVVRRPSAEWLEMRNSRRS